ncbi:hypothetical protein ThidrDRAFT_4245, partial [Thiorhodococcus drewsii AZ1]
MHETARNQPIDRVPEFPEDLPLGTLEQELGTIDL